MEVTLCEGHGVVTSNWSTQSRPVNYSSMLWNCSKIPFDIFLQLQVSSTDYPGAWKGYDDSWDLKNFQKVCLSSILLLRLCWLLLLFFFFSEIFHQCRQPHRFRHGVRYGGNRLFDRECIQTHPSLRGSKCVIQHGLSWSFSICFDLSDSDNGHRQSENLQ